MKQVRQSFRFELDQNGQRRGGRRKGAGWTRSMPLKKLRKA
jgi:hypothetical protein